MLLLKKIYVAVIRAELEVRPVYFMTLMMYISDSKMQTDMILNNLNDKDNINIKCHH